MFGNKWCHRLRASAASSAVTTDTASKTETGRKREMEKRRNSRVKKGLTELSKYQCLKTLFSIESEVLGVPKFWHAPNPPVGLGAPFHILRDGLDVTDEWGDPGPRFKCC